MLDHFISYILYFFVTFSAISKGKQTREAGEANKITVASPPVQVLVSIVVLVS